MTIQFSYNIIDCFPYAVYFTPMTNLFCNWKFVPPNLLCVFQSSLPTPFPLATPCLFSLSRSLFLFYYCIFICFLDSTYKWIIWYFFFWLCLTVLLSMMCSMSMHVVAKGKNVCYRMVLTFVCASCVRLFVTLWTVTHQALLSMEFSRK